MMTIGETYAIICTESIFNRKERKKVIEKLQATGHSVIPIALLKCEILLKCVGAYQQKRRTYFGNLAIGYCSFNISSDKCIGKRYIYYRLVSPPLSVLVVEVCVAC